MKLKDFVFNSLRVRGKKKKAASSGTVAVADIPTGCFGLDKNRNWFPSSHSRRRSRGNSFENDGLTDANWQGNALYQGLAITEDVKENCALLALDYSSRDHGQYSHSEMGTSSSFTGFDRNLDNSYSQDTVSENFGSVSSMPPLSEADTECSSFHQQNYSCHYHHERHNQQGLQHGKNVTTLLQEHNQSIDRVQQQGYKHSQHSQKPETGFFRKSLASFKNIRKDSSKTKLLSSKQTGHAQMNCANSFLPTDTSANKISVPKMSTKIKHRGSNLFSKSKENKHMKYCTENFENQWAVERGINDDLKAAKVAMDPLISTCMLYDRPYVREMSVESCPARHYSFQEELNTRDFDLTGFELASFSGYESDISRSRGRKARSRIKTNPWLPSPQLSLASRWKGYQVQESNDNMPLLEGDWGFPGPDQLENHACDLQPFQDYPTTDFRVYHRKHSSRKSPNGVRMTSNIISSPYSVTKRALDQQYNCFASWEVTSSRTSSLNDLSNITPAIKEESHFSPHAEFSLLAENIEQLATNISFEYEDTFDTTMESVSAGKEMCTDDENSQAPKQKVRNQSRVHMTHSPDSGVDGLGYSDVDNNLTPITQKEATEMSVLCSTSSKHLETSCKVLKEVSDETCWSGRRKEPRINSYRNALTPEFCSNALNNSNTSSLSSHQGKNSQSVTPLPNGRKDDYYVLEEDCWIAMANSVCENKICHQDTHMTAASDTRDGRTLVIEKKSTFMDSKAGLLSNTELDEGQSRITQIHKHNDKFFESSKAVETEVPSHIDIIDVAHAVKQSSNYIPGVDETLAVRQPRPSRLHAKPRMFLNNMEKTSSGRREQQRSWMDEFDFPRNITTSESLESPTENWQWDYQFAMYHSLDTGSPNEQLYRVVFDGSEDTKRLTLDKGSRNIEIEELIVRLKGNDNTNLQQETKETANTKNSLETRYSEKLENEALDENFEMNDACVQTDFDDDFNIFDDVSSVQDLKEELYDLSEGRQVWLPRENLDSSARYENQARDSETMLDKFAILRSEKQKQSESADTTCSEESSPDCDLRHSESKTHVHSDTHSAVSLDLQAKSHTQFESNIRNEIMKQLSSDTRLLTVEKQLDLQSTQKPIINSIKTESEKAVLIPIDGSDTHFGNILNKIYVSCDSQRNEKRPELSLHCCERSVELSDSHSSHSEVVHRKGFPYDRNGNSKVDHRGTSLITTDNVQYSDNISVSTPRSNNFINYTNSSKRILKLERTAGFRNVDANGNFVNNRSRLKRPCESLQRYSTSKQDNFGDFLITPLNANKAAYLNFTADSPLCRSLAGDSSLYRSLVERQLCVAPHANPLRRLRFKQLNSSSLNHSCEDEVPSVRVSPISCPLFTSEMVRSGNYVHQYNKNNQVLLQNDENGIDAFARGQSQMSSSVEEHSLHLMNDQVDNAKHFSPTKETSHGKSNIFPNSVYSFAKCPSNTQSADSTQTSLLETVSYSTASWATGHSKYRFPSTPTETQPTNDSKCLAEKVISLCQEKDLIFQKIYEAKQEEVCRKEHRLQIQRRMQAQTREALLQPLIELRNKLEEQSRRLTEKCNINGNSNSPLRFL